VASVHGTNPEPLMSALGHKRTSGLVCGMSRLPPKADIAESDWHVRFAPKADISALFNYLVGKTQNTQRVRRVAIDRQHHLGREFHWQFAGRRAVQNLVHKIAPRR
jgi:hypothetical protein